MAKARRRKPVPRALDVTRDDLAVPLARAGARRRRPLERRSLGQRLRGNVATGILLAVVGLFASLFAALDIAYGVALERRGVTVDGVVVAVHRARTGGYVTVEYRLADGRPVEARVGNVDWGARPRPSDAFPVRYDPGAPVDNARDGRAGLVQDDTWLAGAVGLASLVGFVLTATGVIDWERLDLRRGRG